MVNVILKIFIVINLFRRVVRSRKNRNKFKTTKIEDIKD